MEISYTRMFIYTEFEIINVFLKKDALVFLHFILIHINVYFHLIHLSCKVYAVCFGILS